MSAKTIWEKDDIELKYNEREMSFQLWFGEEYQDITLADAYRIKQSIEDQIGPIMALFDRMR